MSSVTGASEMRRIVSHNISVTLQIKLYNYIGNYRAELIYTG